MKLQLERKKYVVAVSGGVDSVVLLYLLKNTLPAENLVVAHFDHGIRPDSAEDRKFVEKLAENYGLEFFYEEGRLGSDASEALAREKRYGFLYKILKQTEAEAIVTAHHKDDLIETVIINVLRGTGRKGLSSLADREKLLRPMLNFTKAEILDYAKKTRLQWREDPSNQDEKYLRNFVRKKITPKLSESQKTTLFKMAEDYKSKNRQIDELLENLFLKIEMPRHEFAALSHSVACELVAEWLRRENTRLDKKTVERLVVRLKTAAPGKIIQINNAKHFVIEEGNIRIK